ncbi:hypothetical protein BYT27DRAFT_7188953 [Phlegmacium glaucopus]|nr:hypothetical protein BYT27DRAFT_7188953 [Phlegmacium glaucopus]
MGRSVHGYLCAACPCGLLTTSGWILSPFVDALLILTAIQLPLQVTGTDVIIGDVHHPTSYLMTALSRNLWHQ